MRRRPARRRETAHHRRGAAHRRRGAGHGSAAAREAVDWSLLIGFLRRRREPAGLHEIAAALGVDDADAAALRSQLELLEREGAARCARGGRWSLHSRVRLAVGRIVCPRRHYGFVTPEDAPGADLFVPQRRLQGAVHGDRVLVRLVDSGGSRDGVEAEVLAILDAGSRQVAGTFRATDRSGGGFVEPRDLRLDPIAVHRRSADGPVPGEGDIVTVAITSRGTRPAGTIVEVLGPIEDPGVAEALVVRTHSLPDAFPDAVLEEAEAADGTIGRSERAAREDFTDQCAVTIDPEDAKDHDDAVWVETLAGGEGYRLSVHIADVAWSVRPGSALDREACRRGVSVYLPGRCIPMLPPALSSDRCSLLPGRERRTQSVLMEFDRTGAMTSSRIVDGIIRSAARLSYAQAQELIDSGSDGAIPRMLRDLDALATALRGARMRRGALDLDVPETRVLLDSSGRPADVREAMHHRSHALIEEAMLAANGVAAAVLEKRGKGLFRVHEDPDPAEIDALEEALHAAGCAPPRGGGRAGPRVRGLREHFRGRPEEPMVCLLILRALKLARYASEPGGHFGLAARIYTHFTSPIRRYPDLVVHRIVREARRAGAPPGDAGDLWPVALRCSMLERRAEAAERIMTAIQCAQWMKPKIGEECHGVVVGLNPAVIRLEESGIEGLVQDGGSSARGRPGAPRRSAARSTRLAPGRTVRVRVAAVDVPRGKVYFRTLSNG